MSWDALNTLRSGGGIFGPDPFPTDAAFWKAWKTHRQQILAEEEIARRPYAYWWEILPEDEPWPVWHADQAYMLGQLDLCRNQAEREEVDRILKGVRCDMDARYVEAKKTGRWD